MQEEIDIQPLYRVMDIHQNTIEDIIYKYNNFTQAQQTFNNLLRQDLEQQREYINLQNKKMQALYEYVSKLELLILNRSEVQKV